MPAKTTLTIPVSCVEAGRWRSVGSEPLPQTARTMRPGGRRRWSRSRRRCGHRQRRSDQGAIWQEIAAKSARLARRRTRRGRDVRAAPRLARSFRGNASVERQVGAVFAIRGQIAGLDAFDQPATWRRLMPKLLRSYGLDSVDSALGGDGFSSPSARFLKAATLTKVDAFPAVGLRAGPQVRRR